MISNFKICKCCGKEFERPREKQYGHYIPISYWERYKYCSRECSNKCPERRQKLRESALKAGSGKWMKGKKLSDKTKKKIAAANINHGRHGWKISKEGRMAMSESKKGNKTHLWKGGKTQENALIRTGLEYRLWRESVFKRDNWTCIFCGKRGIRLHADHIKPFATHPESRFDIDNGRTLCVPCHKATPTYLKRNP